MKTMTIQAFKRTIQNDEIPVDLPLSIQALWYDGKDEWAKAHALIDHLNDKISSHIHAYLHRKEGDTWNADYWYRKAGKSRPTISLDQEWEQLVSMYLNVVVDQ